MKDFYYILGTDTDCTLDEIKAAYRKLSKKFHPDLNQYDEYFENRFKEVQEAYEVLSDPARRARYNTALKNFRSDAASSRIPIPKSKTRSIDIGFTLILISITIVFGIYVMTAISHTQKHPTIKIDTANRVTASTPKHRKRKHILNSGINIYTPPVSPPSPQPQPEPKLTQQAPDTVKTPKPPPYLYATVLHANVTGVINMHQAEDLSSVIVKSIPNKSQVFVLQKGDNFYKVRFNTDVGYVPKWTLQIK